MAKPEEALQVAAASYLRRALPDGLPWTAIEPAGRGARDGARQKRKGVNPGWMDIQVTLPPFGTYLGLEAKAENGSPTSSQKDNGDNIVKAGGYWFVFKSLGDLEYILREFGVPLKSRTTELPRKHLVKQIQSANITFINRLVTSYYSTYPNKRLDEN